VTSVASIVLESSEVTHPFGDQLESYFQDSPGGHVVVFRSIGNPKKPATVDHTNAARGREEIFGAYADTYSI